MLMNSFENQMYFIIGSFFVTVLMIIIIFYILWHD